MCVVYDVTRRTTFAGIADWMKEVREHSILGGDQVVLVLVGNKMDQAPEVQRSEASEFARQHGLIFLETSAKTKEGIDQLFREIAMKVRVRLGGVLSLRFIVSVLRTCM